MKTKKFTLVFFSKIILPVLTLAWGFSIAEYKLFPYWQLLSAKRTLMPTTHMGHTQSTGMPHWKMEVSHFKTLRTRPDIIMFGDSITASAEWNELFPSASIINRGISKDTTKGLLERVNEVADRKPKAVFILIGINDIGTGECVDVIFTNYKKLIVYFEERGIKTLIQSTIYPGKRINSLQHQKVLQLNQRLLSYTRGKSMTSFKDLNQVLAPEGFLLDHYTLDGIHLNGFGYEEWARYITSDILSVKGLKN